MGTKYRFKCISNDKNINEMTLDELRERITCLRCRYWNKLKNWDDHGTCILKHSPVDITISYQLCNESCSIPE